MRLSNIVVASLLLAGFGTAERAVPLRLHERRRYLQRRRRRTRHRSSRSRPNQQQCARVDYFVDGQPFVSVVVDGEDRRELARAHDESADPRAELPGVPRYRRRAPLPRAPRARRRPPLPARTSRGDGDGGLEPLIAGVPEYPDAARARGLRGYVEVEFTVTPAGTVESPRVVSAEPRNVFDAAALAAVARRRYPADAERAPQVVTERIEFAPPPAARSRRRHAPAHGPLNQCVREDAVYNYGEMVDVGLINACTEPLMVFGCAQGTGKDRGRWVCSDSEQRGDMLVPAGDQRLGPPLHGRQRRRRPHLHLPRQLLGDARAELAVVVGRLRRDGHGVPLRCPPVDARRQRPGRQRRPAGSQHDRRRELRLAARATCATRRPASSGCAGTRRARPSRSRRASRARPRASTAAVMRNSRLRATSPSSSSSRAPPAATWNANALG